MADRIQDRAVPLLAPLYYRDNFQRLCDTVESRYQDLLSAAERAVLRRWRGLPVPAQCLYVRLVSRVGPWFRDDKLAYPELGEIGVALAQLDASGLLLRTADPGWPELERLFTLAQWRRAFAAELDTAPARGKAELLAAAAALDWAPADYAHRLLASTGSALVAPAGREVVELLQLLFFGNRHQGLTDFVLRDLGIANYYPYALDREQRLFSCREAVAEYQDWSQLADDYWILREAEDSEGLRALAELLLVSPLQYETSAQRYWKLCNRLARELERQGELPLARELYARSGLHPARERLARVLEAAGDWAAARDQCHLIIAGPWCEEECEAAARILPRVCRRLGEAAPARRRDTFATVQLQLPRGDGPVELAVARYLAPQWRAVHYVENSLMNSLFGLAFWEQIFAPVPGAFHHAFQSVPADMYQQGFRARREAMLDQRLTQLRTGSLLPELLAACRRYRGYDCRWVDWRLLDETLLQQLLCCIPAPQLLAVWERMLFDPGENRRGFPDLIALGEREGEYCLIEVKGPGDQLQDSQRRWLRFFAEQDIPAQVARVVWCDD